MGLEQLAHPAIRNGRGHPGSLWRSGAPRRPSRERGPAEGPLRRGFAIRPALCQLIDEDRPFPDLVQDEDPVLDERVTPSRKQEAVGPSPHVAIVIPAHDEAAVIAETLAELPRCKSSVDVVIVADNCTDDTAAIAEIGGRAGGRAH